MHIIVSHKHRFIFFAVPKTATHTIREALRTQLGEEDWEQQVLLGKQSLPLPEIARLEHGHISVRQIRAHLAEEMWSTYFKFAFVRNPFDRYVSTCFFLNRQNPQFGSQSLAFMKEALTRTRFQQRILVQSQSSLLSDENNSLALDYIGRYESLQQSYDKICERIGMPSSTLSFKNTSEHEVFTQYYDEQLRTQVAEFYNEDFRNFDYPQELPEIN